MNSPSDEHAILDRGAVGDPPSSGSHGGSNGGSNGGVSGDGSGGSPSGGGDAKPTKPEKRANRVWLEWALLIAAALIIAVVVRTFVFQAFYIPSRSMDPTLQVGDRVLVNKLSYRLHDPRRGDIVVFEAPEQAATAEVKDLVKRIVGLPGDRIEGRDGQILIDGQPLEEPYLPDGVESRTFGPLVVPPDHYYVLGDNRGESKDSTFFGPVPRGDIVGRAFVRIWPLNHLGFL